MVSNAGLCQRVEEKDAHNYTFFLKIFLNSWVSDHLRDAVQTSKLADAYEGALSFGEAVLCREIVLFSH